MIRAAEAFTVSVSSIVRERDDIRYVSIEYYVVVEREGRQNSSN